MPNTTLHTDTIAFAAQETRDTLDYWKMLTSGQLSGYYLEQKTDTAAYLSHVNAFKGFEGAKLPGKAREMDGIFLVFLACFILTSVAFANGKQFFASIISNIFHVKSHSSIFNETTGNDFRNKLFLQIQSVCLFAVFAYTVLSHQYPDIVFSAKRGLICAGLFGVFFLFYIFYKWVTYRMIGYVFYDRARVDRWMEDWTSLIAFSGIVMFLPVLLLYYMPFLYYFNLCLVLLWFFVTRVIIIYKSYALFFNNLSRLHYLFLYLCAQEIIPVLLLYGGLISIYKIEETSILWM